MKEDSACPCKRDCERHGNCEACKEHHHSWKRVPKTTCERRQARKERAKAERSKTKRYRDVNDTGMGLSGNR